MAIKINLEATENELFCSSKWWGDPDMPADMEKRGEVYYDAESGTYYIVEGGKSQ